MDLMFITNEKQVAIEAEKAGIERIFIDLEINGKYERQGHLDTHISNHSINDIEGIKCILNNSKLLVRVNPYHEGTKNEIDNCIQQGADIIMLPMFKTKYEVEQFVKIVNNRAKVCLLLETAQAFVRINQILEVEGIDEIHIGLNDLHLSLGLDFMFELLSEGIVDYLSKMITDKGIKFGFGGIARIGEGDVPAEIVLGEHYRLKSQMVILSRAFRNERQDCIGGNLNLHDEIKKVREVEANIMNWNEDDFTLNSKTLKKKVREVANKKHPKR